MGIQSACTGTAPAFNELPGRGTCARLSRPCCWRCRCAGRDVGQAADSAAGRWKTIDDKTGKVKSIVEITQAANGALTGKVVEILHSDKGPNPVCDGCEGANKNKPVKGMTILWNLKANGANAWSGGTILDPGNGKTYKSKARAPDRRRQARRRRLHRLHLPLPDMGAE